MILHISPTTATLGAVITGVDLRDPSDAVFARLEAAWNEHAVLVFPEQKLSNTEHIAFSERFGALERSLSARIAEAPELIVLSNVRANGEIAEPGSKRDRSLQGNRHWHTDSSFKPVPSKASLLTARQIPTEGGETEFADMRAAYDELDPDLQVWLGERSAVHDLIYSQRRVNGLAGMSDAELNDLPPVEHPLVRVHPETGRKSLYLGRHASHIVGEELETSRAMLERLCEEACKPPRVFSHRWKVGDLVIWDNRCVLHRGKSYPDNQARVMARTTVAGEAADNPWALSAAD